MVEVRQLLIRVGLLGPRQFAAALNETNARLAVHRESLAKTRTAYLYMSFGLLAAGGLVSRAGRWFKETTDSMIDSFAKVEYQAVIVTSLLGEHGDAIVKVSDKMLELATKSRYSATQVGKAMEEMAAAGFETEEVLGGVAATLRLATAGLTTVENAAEITAGVFRGFGYEAEDAGEAAEILSGIVTQLAQAANESAATMEDLGESLKFVGAAAEMLGIELEEVLAMLEIASNRMIKSGIAGRALRMSFIKIAKVIGLTTDETKSAEDWINRLGLELLDQQGEVKNLADLVDELNTKMADLSAVEKLAAINALFGTRASTLWAAVLEEGGDEIRRREMGLKAASAKEALFNKYGQEGTEILKTWTSEIGEGESALDFLVNELGFTLTTAQDINEVIYENSLSQGEWNTAIEDSITAAQIERERLATLQAQMDITKATLDAMYVSFGRELAPMMMIVNELLQEMNKLMAGLPGPLKAVVAVLMLLAAGLLTNVGMILQVFGAIVMLIAAMVALEQQMTMIGSRALLMEAAWLRLGMATQFVTFMIKKMVFAFFRLFITVLPFIALFLLLEHLHRKFGDAVAWVAVPAIVLLVLWFRRAGKQATSLRWKFKIMWAELKLWPVIVRRSLIPAVMAAMKTMLLFAKRAMIALVNFGKTVYAALGPIGILMLGLSTAVLATSAVVMSEMGASPMVDAFTYGAQKMRDEAALTIESINQMKEAIGVSPGAPAGVVGPARVGEGGAGGKVSITINQNFGDVRLGGGVSLNEFANVVDAATKKAIKEVEWQFESEGVIT